MEVCWSTTPHSLTTPCCFVLQQLFLELIWMAIAAVFTTTTISAGVLVLFCCLGVLFCLYGGVLVDNTTLTHNTMLFCVATVVFRIDLDGHCYCFHNDNDICRCVGVILLSWSFVLFVWRCVGRQHHTHSQHHVVLCCNSCF